MKAQTVSIQSGPKTPVSVRAVALSLAVAATGVSGCLSIIAACERGGDLAERLVWVGLSLVLLLAAHLLPALSRYVPPLARVPAAVLWLAAMAATGYGHLTFFVMAPEHAGAVRAASIPVTHVTPPVTGPSPAAVAAERAGVTAKLASLDTMRCTSHCDWMAARRSTLLARRDALDVAYNEAKRIEAAQDRYNAQQDRVQAAQAAAMADPVVGTLARLVGTTADRLNLAVGLAFGASLELVACFCWFIALPAARHAVETIAEPTVSAAVEVVSNEALPASNEAPVTSNEPLETPAQQGTESIEADSRVTAAGAAVTAEPAEWTVEDSNGDTVEVLAARQVSIELAELVEAVRSDRVRATVAGIRLFKRCGTEAAQEWRRALLEVIPEHVGRKRKAA